MSKNIDKFQTAKSIFKQTKDLLKKWKSSHWDKVGGTITLSQTYSGYYGSSSTSRWLPKVADLVEEELQALLGRAMENAVITARIKMERARKDARTEAQEVLEVTNNE